MDKNVERILKLHQHVYIALLLDLLKKSPEDLTGFFTKCDMRSPRFYADMLSHLGTTCDNMSTLFEKHKKKFLAVFPKLTLSGSAHTYAGYSNQHPPRTGTVHVSQLACFTPPPMGASTDLVRVEIGVLRAGSMPKSIQVVKQQ